MQSKMKSCNRKSKQHSEITNRNKEQTSDFTKPGASRTLMEKRHTKNHPKGKKEFFLEHPSACKKHILVEKKNKHMT